MRYGFHFLLAALLFPLSDGTFAAELNLVSRGRWPLLERDSPSNVATANGYAYLVDQASGLTVVDVRDPMKARPVGGTQLTGKGSPKIQVAGRYAYVPEGANGLLVLDVTNPAHPKRIGALDTPGTARGLAVTGQFVCVADWAAGLQIIDVSDPENPFRAGTFVPPGNPLPSGAIITAAVQDVDVSGRYAYVLTSQPGMHIVDMSDPANPKATGIYRAAAPAGNPSLVAAAGKYVYGCANAGLQIIDVSDPAQPTLVGSLPLTGLASSLEVVGTTVFATVRMGLHIIDVSDPTSPRRLGGYATSGTAYGFSIMGRYA